MRLFRFSLANALLCILCLRMVRILVLYNAAALCCFMQLSKFKQLTSVYLETYIELNDLGHLEDLAPADTKYL